METNTTPKNDNIESIIESNSFNAIIDHFNNKLTENDNDIYNSSNNSDDYESDDEIILDNYLLNKSGENIADILTNINNNLSSLISLLQNNNNNNNNNNNKNKKNKL